LVRYNTAVEVYLLTDRYGVENSNELAEYGKSIGINLKIIIVDLTPLRLMVSKKITLAAYYRLILPEKLPDVDKIIYLDGDTIICCSLNSLWNLNMGDNLIAAVEELEAPKSLKLNLFGRDIPYFNDGVMLMNLKAFRDNNLTDLMLDFAIHQKNKVVYHDQCVLNYFLQGKWFKLPASYNLLACHLLNRERYITAIQKPMIVHYNSYYGKPWDYYCTHPMKNLYLEIKKQTPWKLEKLTRNDYVSYYRGKFIIFDVIIVSLRKVINKVHIMRMIKPKMK
jgi:lipopolysaccharide biosynthesis glycosyltransferase